MITDSPSAPASLGLYTVLPEGMALGTYEAKPLGRGTWSNRLRERPSVVRYLKPFLHLTHWNLKCIMATNGEKWPYPLFLTEVFLTGSPHKGYLAGANQGRQFLFF